MRPAVAAVLFWAGLGILGPAAACIGLRMGIGVSWCAAMLTGALVAAWTSGLRQRPGAIRMPLLFLVATAATASCVAVMPLCGIRAAGVIGLTLTLAGGYWAWTITKFTLQPAWIPALTAAATVSWARCLGLLWGHSLYALCGLMAGAGLGIAIGFWLKDRVADILAPATHLPGLWTFVSALAGLLALSWLRFIGINSGEAGHIIAPLRDGRDFLFIAGQSLLAVAFWCASLPLAWGETAGAPYRRRACSAKIAAGLIAAAGPCAAAILIPRLGAAECAAGCHLALCLTGLARIGLGRLRESRLFSRFAAAGLVIAGLLALQSRGLFIDIWLNRLNAAYPGGRFLAQIEDGRECLGAFRLVSAEVVLLRDGASASWNSSGVEARREAHLPLLMHGSCRRVLLSGARHPATTAAALAHGVDLVALDPQADIGAVLRVQAPAGWPPALTSAPDGARLSLVTGDLRRHLRASGPFYDAIIWELPYPALTPEWSRLATREAFVEVRRRLAPMGVAAIRLPAPYPVGSLARALRTARSVFPHAVGFDLPGGYLLVCSDQPLPQDPATLLARRNVFVQADDLALEEALPALHRSDYTVLPPDVAALAPDTDDRPHGFFPLAEWARGLVLNATPAEDLHQLHQ